MDGIASWWEGLRNSLADSLNRVGDYMPTLAAAIGVMIIGVIVARVLRALLVRSSGALNTMFTRLGRPMTVARLKISRRIAALAANIVFWVVILLFAAVAARVAGLGAFTVWLDRVVGYLPTLAAGVMIVLAGWLLSTLARDVVSTGMASFRSRESRMAGFSAQIAVFVTALVVGLDQIGIDVTFLTMLASVTLGGILLSLAIAFGFGARDFVANLTAAREIRGSIEPGEIVRIGEFEGRLLEIRTTSIVLIGEDGRLLIPASLVQRQPIAVLGGPDDE